MGGIEKKIPNTRESFAVTPKMKKELRAIASNKNITVSELIRKYVEDGLLGTKTAKDIDFIRENLREEIDLALDKSTNRIIGLLYKVGIYSVTSALLNSEIIKNFVKVKDEADIEKYMNCKEKAIKEANIILHNTNKKIEDIADDL